MRYAVVGLLTILGCCGLVAADIPGPASLEVGRLVFIAARAVEGQAEADKPPYGLYLVGLDGTGLVCLEPDLRAGPHRPFAAAWSPDGTGLWLRGTPARRGQHVVSSEWRPWFRNRATHR